MTTTTGAAGSASSMRSSPPPASVTIPSGDANLVVADAQDAEERTVVAAYLVTALRSEAEGTLGPTSRAVIGVAEATMPADALAEVRTRVTDAGGAEEAAADLAPDLGPPRPAGLARRCPRRPPRGLRRPRGVPGRGHDVRRLRRPRPPLPGGDRAPAGGMNRAARARPPPRRAGGRGRRRPPRRHGRRPARRRLRPRGRHRRPRPARRRPLAAARPPARRGRPLRGRPARVSGRPDPAPAGDAPLPALGGRAAAGGGRPDEAGAAPPSGLVVAVTGGPAAGQALALDRPVTVGRSPACDVVTPDPTVSTCHARFDVTAAGHVTVTDLGSHNGTLVDGVAVEGTAAVPLDALVQLGATDVRVRRFDEADRHLGVDPRHSVGGVVPFNRPPRTALPEAPAEIDAPESPARRRGDQAAVQRPGAGRPPGHGRGHGGPVRQHPLRHVRPAQPRHDDGQLGERPAAGRPRVQGRDPRLPRRSRPASTATWRPPCPPRASGREALLPDRGRGGQAGAPAQRVAVGAAPRPRRLPHAAGGHRRPALGPAAGPRPSASPPAEVAELAEQHGVLPLAAVDVGLATARSGSSATGRRRSRWLAPSSARPRSTTAPPTSRSSCSPRTAGPPSGTGPSGSPTPASPTAPAACWPPAGPPPTPWSRLCGRLDEGAGAGRPPTAAVGASRPARCGLRRRRPHAPAGAAGAAARPAAGRRRPRHRHRHRPHRGPPPPPLHHRGDGPAGHGRGRSSASRRRAAWSTPCVAAGMAATRHGRAPGPSPASRTPSWAWRPPTSPRVVRLPALLDLDDAPTRGRHRRPLAAPGRRPAPATPVGLADGRRHHRRPRHRRPPRPGRRHHRVGQERAAALAGGGLAAGRRPRPAAPSSSSTTRAAAPSTPAPGCRTPSGWSPTSTSTSASGRCARLEAELHHRERRAPRGRGGRPAGLPAAGSPRARSRAWSW